MVVKPVWRIETRFAVLAIALCKPHSMASVHTALFIWETLGILIQMQRKLKEKAPQLALQGFFASAIQTGLRQL